MRLTIYALLLALGPWLTAEGWQFSPSVEGRLKDRQRMIDDGYLTKNEDVRTSDEG